MNNVNNKINSKELNSKKNALKGTLTQARGVARQTWGQVTHNPMLQLAGKKDKVVGALQRNLGDSWAYRHKNLVASMSLVAMVAAAVFYFMNRSSPTMTAENQNQPYYAH